MRLTIIRYPNLLLRTEDIISFNIDGVSLSSIDYWSQEARKASITIFYTPALKNVLEGPERNVIFGFHTLEFSISHNNKTIFIGALADGAFTVEYLSHNIQTIEFNLIDFLGVLLQLADNHTFHLGSSTHPVNIIPQIIASTFMNNQNDDNSNPPLVRQLRSALPSLSWTNAATFYNEGIWLPWNISNYVLYNYNQDKLPSFGYTSPIEQDILNFGLFIYNNHPSIYFSHYKLLISWHHLFHWQGDVSHFLEIFRSRIYLCNDSNISLIEQTDIHNINQQTPLSLPEPPELAQYIFGINNYRIEGPQVLYSGIFHLDNLQTDPGDYNARELLSEFLILAHAVLINLNGSFKIVNRIDPSHPYLIISDPISASFNEAEPADQPEAKPVSITDIAIYDSVNRYYKNFLSNHGLTQEAEIKIIDTQLPTLQSPDNIPIPSNPYELINFIFIFDNHYIFPKQIDYDFASGEITITGWAGPFIP